MTKLVHEDAQALLEPLHVGVGMQGVFEVIVHVCRHFMEMHAKDPDTVFAHIDFDNAFNGAERHEILSGTRELFPSLAPWADWCYGRACVQRFVGPPAGPLSDWSATW